MRPSLSAQLRLPPTGLQSALQGEFAANQQPPALYGAIAKTALHSGVPAKTVAPAAGMKYAHLTDLANESRRVSLKVVEAVALTLATSNFAIADWFEAQIGRVAFVLPPENVCGVQFQRELAESVKEFGAYLERAGAAIADGRIDRHELPELLSRADTLLAGIAKVRAMAIEQSLQDAPPSMAKAALR